MKKILLVYNSKEGWNGRHLLQSLKEQWMEMAYDVEELDIGQKVAVPCEMCLQKTDAEYIISLDMAGFQYKTLLDNFLYHIIPKKQLHLIMDEKIWKNYEKTDFALNLFIYVPDPNVAEIQENAEAFNIRCYPKGLLDIEKELAKQVVNDFLNMIK